MGRWEAGEGGRFLESTHFTWQEEQVFQKCLVCTVLYRNRKVHMPSLQVKLAFLDKVRRIRYPFDQKRHEESCSFHDYVGGNGFPMSLRLLNVMMTTGSTCSNPVDVSR